MTDPLDSRDLWARLEPAIDQFFELGPDERSAFLETKQREDPEVHRALVRIWSQDSAVLEAGARSLAAPLFADDLSPLLPGMPVGRYRVVRELGEGGMGMVYLAERADGQFEMPVALKVIQSTVRGDGALEARFLEEQRILARLHHPNIARLLDGGVAADGRPFYAMEYVQGDSLVAHADRHQLTVEQRLALFLKACGAVQYAHEHLVIHRDLKPSNIMVDQDGEVKLLDFGISKYLGAADGEQGKSAPATMLLTPQYASPEQLRGEPVSTASDVYSLGVVLYELLSGRRPVSLEGVPPHRWADELAREAAPPPSAVSTMSLSRDLDAIVGAALRYAPQGRYRTVAALAADVRRFLDGLPVEARPATWRYRVARFGSRHRLGVTLGALAALVLATFVSVTVRQSRRIQAEGRAALLARDRAQRVNDFLISVFGGMYPYTSTGGIPTPSRLLDSAYARLEREFADRPEDASAMLSEISYAYQGVGDFPGAIRAARRGVELQRGLPHPDSGKLAAQLLTLGQVLSYAQGGEHGEAELRESLSIQLSTHDDTAWTVARGLNALGVHLARRGMTDEAERLTRRALALDSLRQPVDTLMLAQGYRNLAHALRIGGRARDALPLYRQALTLVQGRFADANPEVGNAMINLGLALDDLGQRDSALALVSRGLAIRYATLGRDHDDVAPDETAYARLLIDAGQDAQAVPLLDHALRLARRGPPASLVIADALRQQGRLHLRRGARATGCALLEEQAAIVDAMPGLTPIVRQPALDAVGPCRAPSRRS